MSIATYNEGPLHASLKSWYAKSGDRVEVPFEGREIDLVRGDLLIEIQTSGLGKLRKKIESLIDEQPIRVVYPLPIERWIVRVEGPDRKVLGRRKSPRKGRFEDVFEELVSLSRLLPHPHLSVDVVLTREDEIREKQAGRRAWRKKGWVTVERQLNEVMGSTLLETPEDLTALLPDGLPTPFTTADLAGALHIARDLAQKMAYCLREAEAIVAVGKQGNARLYQRA